MPHLRDPKVAVVTGATAGVGRATAIALARAGSAVALIARDESALEATAQDVRDVGGTAITISLDVADPDAVDAAADRVEAELGPIDVWVNNAMAAVLAPVTETSAAEFRRVTEVTYLGYVHGTLAALRHMSRRNHGTIVQVGSALSQRAIPLQATYCAAKHAIKGFTDALRCELLHDGSRVHVTMVQLPGLNTPQFGWVKTVLRRHPQPVPPIYQPEVAARAIVWAATHRRRELYVGLPTPLVIWAGRLAPALVDRYLARTSYSAQQSDIAIDPEERLSYLWQPVKGAHRTHGIFDSVAKSTSLQMEAATHRGATVTGLCALAIAGGLGINRRRSST